MMRVNWMIALGLTAAAIIFSMVVYPTLPERIPTHWNIHGEVDAHGAKEWAVFLTPGIMLMMLGLLWVLPKLSPKQFEIDTFKATYSHIVLLVMGLLAFIHVIVTLPAMGYQFRLERVMLAGMMLFFMFLGNVLGKVQRNFYVGVRTPWTLASERVWTETHRFAAWTWVGMGLLGLISILAGLSILVPTALIFVAVVAVVLFSLIRYKQLERQGELEPPSA